MAAPVVVRPALNTEIDALTSLWHDAWRDAHAAILPPELVRLRTPDNFRQRLERHLPHTRVAGEPGAAVGFHVVLEAELYQLFVASQARGTGVAAALIADAEAMLFAAGVRTAWLACAIGNHRAARFYEKCGWRRVGTFISELETPDGVFPLEVWRYEKRLAAAPSEVC